MLQHGVEGPRELRSGPLQLFAMGQREFAQDGSTGRGLADPHLAAVRCAFLPGDHFRGLHTIDQFHSAVVLNEESRRNLADGRLHAVGQAVDQEEELVLLRLDAVGFGGDFAEVDEAADLPAELGEVTVLLAG